MDLSLIYLYILFLYLFYFAASKIFPEGMSGLELEKGSPGIPVASLP